MKRLTIFIFALAAVLTLQAQTTFNEANELYAAGAYNDAIAAYEYILQDSPSAELYYNLGNAYFKTGEIGKSILSYERALRLKPYYSDARYNLRFAQTQIIDNIEDNHSFFLSHWVTMLRNLLREDTWAILSIVFFLLTLCGILFFAFSRTVILRKIGFHTAWVALLLSLATMGFAASLHSRDKNREEAIVMQGIVNAKASPDQSGTDLFTLHEGTKVYIRSTVSDWAEIVVGNNRGWVRLNNLERI